MHTLMECHFHWICRPDAREMPDIEPQGGERELKGWKRERERVSFFLQTCKSESTFIKSDQFQMCVVYSVMAESGVCTVSEWSRCHFQGICWSQGLAVCFSNPIKYFDRDMLTRYQIQYVQYTWRAGHTKWCCPCVGVVSVEVYCSNQFVLSSQNKTSVRFLSLSPSFQTTTQTHRWFVFVFISPTSIHITLFDAHQ